MSSACSISWTWSRPSPPSPAASTSGWPTGRKRCNGARAVDARRVIAGLPQALTTVVQFAGGCGHAQYELERLALVLARSGLDTDPASLQAITEAVLATLRASDPSWSPALERRWRGVLAIAMRGLRRAAPAA